MNDAILTNLNNKFRAMELGVELTDKDFDEAVFEYSAYIGYTRELSNIIKELAQNHDIDRKIFGILFMYSALRNGFRNKHLKKDDVGLPLFWNKSIEEEFGLVKDFLETLSLERKRLFEAKKQNINIYEIVIPEDEEELKKNGMTDDEQLFKFHILHNKIIEIITRKESKGVMFDVEKSNLHIGNTLVPFRKFTEQYHTLKILFENKHRLNEEWFFSEISQKIDRYAKYSDKAIHNYLSAIKKRVAVETGIKDLFITTNQSVRINTDYL